MLEFTVIGPGRKSGNYYAGYHRPAHPGQFVPLADCNTHEQACEAAAALHREAQARERATFEQQANVGQRFPIRGFYDDEGQV